jgi:hypothetical protein
MKYRSLDEVETRLAGESDPLNDEEIAAIIPFASRLGAGYAAKGSVKPAATALYEGEGAAAAGKATVQGAKDSSPMALIWAAVATWFTVFKGLGTTKPMDCGN